MTNGITNEDPLMDDGEAGDAVAKYLEDNPDLLQGIVPVHNLWPAIESRISARAIPISAAPVRVTHRSLGWMPMLLAASALIAASAGITYVLSTRGATVSTRPGSVASTGTRPDSSIATGTTEKQATIPILQPQQNAIAVANKDVPARGGDDSPTVVRDKRPAVQLASHPAASESDEMRTTYDSEITRLHVALDARRGQLNQSTVAIIEQNLRVIDDAIRQSKEALAKDPNSRLLNDQLDHTLAKKTGLLRAAALLPAA
ncbi:MAG: hypothetical protein ABI229_12130 [Gemmatimonadaceae bacterium]